MNPEDRNAETYDLVRALVCAFASRGSDLLVPVSTGAVQNEFKRRNLNYPISEAMHELGRLGDLQRLERGFWLPTPCRLVVWRETGLLLSGLPTAELMQRYKVNVETLGIGRLVESVGPLVGMMPTESMACWVNAPTSTHRWAIEYVSRASWRDPYGLETVQIFRSWRASSQDRWLGVDRLRVNRDEVVLARHRAPDARTNYYLLRTKAGRVDASHELPPDFDIPRLMCAFRSRDGDPIVGRFRRLDSRCSEFFVDFVPQAEEELLRALARLQDPNARFVTSGVVLTSMVEALVIALEALGAKIESRMI